jgi:hypothetical protein
MWQEQYFKWLEVCCQVEHGVESLKVGLSEWQFNIKF